MPKTFKFTTTAAVPHDDTILKDCIPLLSYVANASRWWSPNMSRLFEGPLRPYFSLYPNMSLDKHKMYLTLQTRNSPDEPEIHYSSTDPVRINDEWLVHYKRGHSARLPSLWRSMCWAWTVQIGLGALQKALGRHVLGRMSKITQLRLYVCLVVLLKFVSEYKNNAVHRAVLDFPLMSEQDFRDANFISQPWNRMRDHLLDAITCYLKQLSLRFFPANTAIPKCFVKYSDGLFATYSIFPSLENELVQLFDQNMIDTQMDQQPELKPCALENSSATAEGDYHEQLSLAFAGCKLDNNGCGYLFKVEDPVYLCDTCKLGEGQHGQRVGEEYSFPLMCRACSISCYHGGHSIEKVDETDPRKWQQTACGQTSSARPVDLDQIHCGYVFLENDLMRRCYTCEGEERFQDVSWSVLCQRCFNFDHHENHIIETYNATGNGGFCDCGDPTAWKTNDGKLWDPCSHTRLRVSYISAFSEYR